MQRRPIIGINTDYSGKGGYRINGGYVDCIADAGGLPLLIPCLQDRKRLVDYMAFCAGFLLIGGRDYPPEFYGQKAGHEHCPIDPRRADSDLRLCKMALKMGKPILGICGGLQLVHIALGGLLIQHIPTAEKHRESRHSVKFMPGSRLCRIFGKCRMNVNSYHHQAVDPGSGLPDGFKVVALAADGVVEAIEAEGRQYMIGVQWHPERMLKQSEMSATMKLFRSFVRACDSSSKSDIQ